MSELVIPVEHFAYVAEVIKRLTSNGVPPKDLFVSVREGEMELRDDSGSYGVRRWVSA